MAVINKVCNVPFCWKLFKIKIVTTAFLFLFALYLYGSWFQSQMSYLSPNMMEKAGQKLTRRSSLKKNNFPNELDQRDEKNSEVDLGLKKNSADNDFLNKKSRMKKFRQKLKMDEGDQNENVDSNKILDKKMYPKRKKFPSKLNLDNGDHKVDKFKNGLKERSVENDILDKKSYAGRKNNFKEFHFDDEDTNKKNLEDGLTETSAENGILDKNNYPDRQKQQKDIDLEDEDIKEMSRELLENYKNDVFDRRLLKKKGRWEKMQNMQKYIRKQKNFENFKDDNFEKIKDGNFEKSKDQNFEKSRTSRENKKISKMTKVLKNHMDLKQRLPQCIIIGMRKAGTKALITFLELNKNIKAARKEVHFFDTDENYNKGFDWYKEQMPYSHADQITIEKTPRYVLEDKVPDRIYRMNSSIKLILIVKEPVLRAISEYAQNYARSKKNRQMTFEEYSLKRGTGEVNIEYAAINRSIYYQHMPKWLNRFHRKQILIVDGDELVIKPEFELNKIENFLGLKQEINSDMFYFNKTKGFKCARRDDFSEPICLGVNKGRDHPVVLSSVIKKLQDFYRPLNKKFFKLVNQEFNWP